MDSNPHVERQSMTKTFHNLSDALETDYDEELTEKQLNTEFNKSFQSSASVAKVRNQSNDTFELIEQELNEIDIRKDDLENQLVSAKIRDVDFLTREIKSLILSSKRVLSTLERDIKIGSAPRMYEVYASLLNAITSQYKELRQLNEAVAKFIIENKKQNLDEVKEEHKMVMNSTDMLNMFMNAKNNSEIETLNADFEVTEDLKL